MKRVYIISGWQDNPNDAGYRKIADTIRDKGYEINPINIDWNREIFPQLPVFEPSSVLFGFSIGAIVAKIISQNVLCELLIMASPTPLKHFNGGKDELDLAEVIGYAKIYELKSKLTNSSMALKILTIYGDKEGEKADIYVPETDHEINENYVKVVSDLF